MALTKKIAGIPRLTFDSSGLTGSYQTMSAAGFTKKAITIKIVNNSDADIDVSYNGSDDEDFVPANSAMIVDGATNCIDNNGGWPIGQQVFLKGSSGTGNIYAIAYTQVNQ